jgi:hypothetical protein
VTVEELIGLGVKKIRGRIKQRIKRRAMSIVTVSKQWAGDSGAFDRLLEAVVTAEGNIIKAVQCSIPTVTTEDEALQVLARSATHAMADWIELLPIEQRQAFVAFWGARWAPVGVKNDPTGLNANWVENVEKGW